MADAGAFEVDGSEGEEHFVITNSFDVERTASSFISFSYENDRHIVSALLPIQTFLLLLLRPPPPPLKVNQNDRNVVLKSRIAYCVPVHFQSS